MLKIIKAKGCRNGQPFFYGLILLAMINYSSNLFFGRNTSQLRE